MTESLNLPQAAHQLAELRGLVLLAGAPRSGRTTTFQFVLDQARDCHILLLQEHQELRLATTHSLVTERALGDSPRAWKEALTTAFCHNPDIVALTRLPRSCVPAAMELCAQGRRVITTCRGTSAAQVLSRFSQAISPKLPELSQHLAAVMVQRLVPALPYGRLPAVELLIATPAIRNLVREKKWDRIPTALECGFRSGQENMDCYLAALAMNGRVTPSVALEYANDPGRVRQILSQYGAIN